MSHPAIADAVAVGVPSAEWGEAVGIAVVDKAWPGQRPATTSCAPWSGIGCDPPASRSR